MDRSAVRAIVEREIKPLMDALGVSWWKIEVHFGPAKGSREPADGFGVVARCDRDAAYNRATITIDPEACDDDGEVIEFLRHELIHIVLAPFDAYRDFAVCLIEPNTPTDRQEDMAFRQAIEQAVIAIERIWKCYPEYLRARSEAKPAD